LILLAVEPREVEEMMAKRLQNDGRHTAPTEVEEPLTFPATAVKQLKLKENQATI